MAHIKLRIVKECYEVIINHGVMAYRNIDIDKAVAWLKLNYKLSDEELENLKDAVKNN